jgi:Asp-tRNA(Asn)/Glu-tRNA(Gln) amidotransferase A subunit family amidase
MVERIRRGEWRSADIVGTCLQRIAELDASLHAYVGLDAERALEQARLIDSGQRRGALCGVPVAIKDVIDTDDMATEYGSSIYRGHRPAADATCVAMLREAGAVVLGKTGTCEFALNHPALTVNPHDFSRTPGGSSSGSAAAVASGTAPCALGTQTGGSTIRPASYCGVVGFKPSFGRIPMNGVRAISPSFDTAGVLTRSVADAALLGRTLMRAAELVVAEPARPPRVGVCHTAAWSNAEEPMRVALNEAARRVGEAGGDVIEVSLPAAYDALDEAHRIVMAVEVRRALDSEIRNAPDRLLEGTRRVLEFGSGNGKDYDRALNYVLECRRRAHSTLFEDLDGCDVLITPSAAGEPPDMSTTGSASFNSIWTALHLPCISLPGLKGPTGLPLGIQLVGRWRQDAALLTAAAWVERLL